MGCDDYPLFQNRYELQDVVAELWNTSLAKRFPHTSHQTCFQAMKIADDGSQYAVPFTPARCQDWHCPRCGAATGMYGHRQCDNTTQRAEKTHDSS